ncbi:MAG: glycosyltransferase [Deltaproteobacteria bacterium]|nr:glycosyltransferase [Deltaproteobacteria bacterium]
MQLVILMPVYNDWATLKQILPLLDSALASTPYRPAVVVVDDGSTDPLDEAAFKIEKYKSLASLDVIELGRNLGNQRAVSMGLAYISENIKCDAVVLMDADGEDSPSDVPRLIQKFQDEGGRKMVFAARVKRAEHRTFRIFYYFYKQLYKASTGTKISMGNFSIIPARILARMAVISEIGNHYVAGVLKARIPYTQIDTARSPRLGGRSKMNFTALVMHAHHQPGHSRLGVDARVVADHNPVSGRDDLAYIRLHHAQWT